MIDEDDGLWWDRFAAVNLSPKPEIPDYDLLMNKLAESDRARVTFLKACLEKLGLEPNTSDSAIPALSTLHLSSSNNSEVAELLCGWESIMDKEDGVELIRGETDTFRIENEEEILSMSELEGALPQDVGDMVLDYENVVKKIVPHERELPTLKQTPHFNHKLFFADLQRFQKVENDAESWGNILMYGDVVTSTNTLLEK